MLKLLFICIENSCRSQMAEAFARMYGGGEIEAFSAGSQPSGEIHPEAVTAMKELGYDMSEHRSTGPTALPSGEFDYVITMGCGDACPKVAARHRRDWDIRDPKNLSPESFREVRDEIGARVRRLIDEASG